jgi:hypothetical protein
MLIAVAANGIVLAKDRWPLLLLPAACIGILLFAWVTYERRWGWLWHAYKGCRRGHTWFPEPPTAREFIPTMAICLRCTATVWTLPWGECLGGHPIREHYNEAGDLVELPSCRCGGPM